MDRHGGNDAWKSIQKLHVTCTKATGSVWRLKGAGKTFAIPKRFVICPKTQETSFPNFPEPGCSAVFSDRTVRVYDSEGVKEFPKYRTRFDGLSAKLRPWTNTDVAYFVGYSMPLYHGYPFTLPSLKFVNWRRTPRRTQLTLEYVDTVDCHSRRQTFHFDETGLLIRVDYKADIVGPGPLAAHHYEEYREVCGLQFPTRRRVLARVLGIVWPLNLVSVDLSIEPLAGKD